MFQTSNKVADAFRESELKHKSGEKLKTVATDE